MATKNELCAKDPQNTWVAIDKKTGDVVSEGKSPIEASKDVKNEDEVIYSFVTNDENSYIF